MQTKRNAHLIWLFGTAFALLVTLPLQAQKTADKPDVQPEFPGGMPALVDFMVKNINYPEAAKKEQATGLVLVRFAVGKDGSISEIKTITEGSQNPREDFVREAVRVIRAMPKWTPAESKGKPVKAELTLPIKFALDGNRP